MSIMTAFSIMGCIILAACVIGSGYAIYEYFFEG